MRGAWARGAWDERGLRRVLAEQGHGHGTAEGVAEGADAGVVDAACEPCGRVRGKHPEHVFVVGGPEGELARPESADGGRGGLVRKSAGAVALEDGSVGELDACAVAGVVDGGNDVAMACELFGEEGVLGAAAGPHGAEEQERKWLGEWTGLHGGCILPGVGADGMPVDELRPGFGKQHVGRAAAGGACGVPELHDELALGGGVGPVFGAGAYGVPAGGPRQAEEWQRVDEQGGDQAERPA